MQINFFTKEHTYQCDDSDFKNCFFQKKKKFFKIIGKDYKISKFRRKLAESLHIKEKRSSLNT